jgi:L-cysteine desulfidase
VKSDKMVGVLRSQVVPVIGCTEPVSIAISVATAKAQMKNRAEKVKVKLSVNILKNGMRVGIPGTNEKGIPFAIALALANGNGSADLSIFKDIEQDAIDKAHKIVDSGIIEIEAIEANKGFYIKTQLFSEDEEVEVVIEDNHTNIISIKKNGFDIPFINVTTGSKNPNGYQIEKLDDIYTFIEEVDIEKIAFLKEGVEMNLAIAEEGKNNPYCSALGPHLFSLIESGKVSNDILNRMKAYTASGSDARMGGANFPVMSSSGSGNHGLTAIIPVAILAEELNSSEEELLRALALSHLITSYIKQKAGRLSPICGCAIAAGIGASAAMTYLQGGKKEQIDLAILNMVGTLAGLICDGAKGGCSFKLVTAVNEAYTQSLLALDGTSIALHDGIVGSNSDETIDNLGKLSQKGMEQVDKFLVDIML